MDTHEAFHEEAATGAVGAAARATASAAAAAAAATAAATARAAAAAAEREAVLALGLPRHVESTMKAVRIPVTPLTLPHPSPDRSK